MRMSKRLPLGATSALQLALSPFPHADKRGTDAGGGSTTARLHISLMHVYPPLRLLGRGGGGGGGGAYTHAPRLKLERTTHRQIIKETKEKE